MLGVVLSAFAFGGAASSAYGATGANFIATGHDMDFHCAEGTTSECNYFKIVVDKVRNGSSLPILALDQGTEVATALVNAGYSSADVVTVDPSNATVFNATPFTDGAGNPLYSAIITASDSTCGGCDNTPAGESNINARASDFTTYFNHGGGILALAGAENYSTYYNFVPLTGVTGVAVTYPFTVTSDGTALGITNTMANCCATHNSFVPPSSPFVILENDSATPTPNAETIAAFNASIGGGGFTTADPTSLSVSPASGDYADATTVSAVLTDTTTSSGVAGKTVTFKLNGSETCSGTTDSTGKASCALTPGEAAGTYTLAASFAGDSSFQPSSGSANFVVNLEQTALSYTGPTTATKGHAVTMSGKLTTDDPAAGTALAGKTVTFTLGSGSTAQTCSGTTNASGIASCTIAAVNQSTGSVPVAARYAGDTHYAAASASATMTVAAVQAATVVRGHASVAGIGAACVRGSFAVHVRGAQIASVRFTLGGARLHTTTVSRGKNYSARISVSPGAHTLTVTVRFRAASKTHSRTFHRTIVGCAAAVPKFTG